MDKAQIVEAVIRHFGGMQETAAACGVHLSTVYKWRSGDVSREYAIELARQAGCEVSPDAAPTWEWLAARLGIAPVGKGDGPHA